MNDQAQREAALDPARSFIVQAPAGSGKTELLVRRYLRLLQTVQRPEEILAITFTKKAAAEMRLRVLKHLPAADIAHRLRIQTIDALCASLTRQMPVLARFGAQPEIVEDARELYLEAAARTLTELTPAVERLLAHLDNNVGTATGLLADMLQNRDRWLRRTGEVPTRADLEANLVSERNRLLKKAQALHPAACEEFARLVLTKDGGWRKKPKAPPELAEIPGLREALFALCSLPPARYDDAQWETLEAILALLRPAVAQLKVLFGERGQADFTEFSHGALEALGSADDPSELLLQLDSRIGHILVDEFQDTSVSQWLLLERLTAGWSAGDGRSLFLVGDPMQSIYRFREAEVGLFLRARREGIGDIRLEPLTLTTNFRSQGGIVTWVNEAFARILPPSEDEASGAVPYSPATARHDRLAGPAVTWHAFYDRAAEARQVVNLLGEAQGKAAILVRNRGHLDHIVPALKDAGIRFRAVEIEQLGEKQVVQDLYALTRALCHLGDRIAWLSILRAPWCGLTLEDLHRLAGVDHPEAAPAKPEVTPGGQMVLPLLSGEGRPGGGDGPVHRERATIWELLQTLDHLTPDGQARAARLRDTLAPAVANRLRGTLRDRVEGAWLALGGPACVEDATGLEEAEAFLDELERLEEAGDVDVERLAQSLDELYAPPDVSAGPDAVEIMTIHKSKGLEFDTVILPGLDRSPRNSTKPLFAWKTLPGGRILLAPIDETGADKDEIFQYVLGLEKEAEDIEAGRLFYVAATRAESRLHLLACAKCDDEGETRVPAKRSLLSRIWFQAAGYFGPAPAEAAKDAAAPSIPDRLRRLPASFAAVPVPASVKWRDTEDAREDLQIEFSWAGETARHVGTVVHRWLQKIAEDQLRGWDAKRVESLCGRFASDLERRGVPAVESKAAAELVVSALKSSLADERGQWILGPHAEAKSEYRMRARTPEGMRSYVMDRVFRDADGQRWIVDYKTSRHEGSDVGAFLDRERDRYAPQLRAYGEILEGSRQGLYFPLLKGWRQCDG